LREIPEGRECRRRAFKLAVFQEGAAAGRFDTSQTKTDTPTLKFEMLDEIYFTGAYAPSPAETNVPYFKKGIINRIHYRIKAANPVTFTLRIYRDAIGNNYESNMSLLYESPALQTSDVDYDRTELVIPFLVGATGLYYALEWTGATGNVNGFIEVSGETPE